MADTPYDDGHAAHVLAHSTPLLQALLARSADMMTVSNRDGRVIYASPATERVSGYTVAEFMARHPFETIHPDDQVRCQAEFARLLATPGLSLELQHRVLHKDGTWHWVEGTFTNLFDDPGVGGLVANIRDITRRKAAESDLAIFKMASEYSNDAQYLIDDDGRIHWVNRLACEWLGYSFEELTALTIDEINPLVAKADLGSYFELARQSRVAPFESLHRRKDGSTIPVEIAPTVVEIDGQARMLAAVRDISERKRAQEALQQSEVAFRTLANAAPALVWIFSPSGENIFFNERWFEFTGQTEEQAAGTGWAVTMHPDDSGRILSYWEHCQKTGATYQGEVRYRRRDGQYRWHVFRALPRRAANGAIEAWYGVSVDTHDAKQAQEALHASEERLRIAVDAAEMGTWHWDLTTDDVRWNERHFTLLGMEPRAGPVKPADFFARVHPEDRARLHRQLERSISERVLFEAEFRAVLPDGSIRWMDDYGQVVEELEGRATGISGVMLDMTRRKQAEAALRASEERFRTVVDLVPDLLWSNDTRGDIDWYNQRWLDYTGQTPQDGHAYGWLDVIHPADRDSSQRAFQTTIDSGQPLRQEHRIRGTDGSYRWFLVQALPLRDESGAAVRWFGAATDIHEERVALAEAQAALETRDQFLSIASHELRTPMTALLGYVHILRRVATQGGNMARPLDMIERQVQRLDTLVGQLLDVARLRQGQFAVQLQPLDLAALVSRVVDDLRVTLPVPSAHTIELTLPVDALPVQGDAQRLEAVVQNLLSNAIKYSPSGGAVRVRLSQQAAEATLEVEDRGIGIPAEAQARLFEAFYRAQNVASGISGFGLGLYIVTEIVTLHGGRVEVTSREGVGSTFRVVLPLLTSH